VRRRGQAEQEVIEKPLFIEQIMKEVKERSL
jgi:hypothetical protein